MGQVTIYLADEVESRMTKAAKSAHLSKSKWITKLIQEKVANEWPQSVVSFAGSWEDASATEFSQEKGVNGILWERFSAQHQANEINELWPEANYQPE